MKQNERIYNSITTPYAYEYERLYIIGFRGTRLRALQAIRKLLPVGLYEAKRIIDNLPHFLKEDELISNELYREVQALGFNIEIFSRTVKTDGCIIQH